MTTKKPNELQAVDPDYAAMMEMTSVQGDDLRAAIHDDDKREPRVTLVQAMSELATSGEAQPGSIAHGADGYVYAAKGEAMTIVPLLYFKSRRRFEQRDDDDMANRILCESRGGRVGNGDPGGQCSTCAYSEWSDRPDGTRKPPECDPQHNVLVYVPDADAAHQLAIISFARTSYPAGTKLINKLLGLDGVFWGYAFKIVARQAESGRHKFFVYDLQQWDDTGKYEKLLPQAYPDSWREQFMACEGLYQKMRAQYDFSREVAKPAVAKSDDVPF